MITLAALEELRDFDTTLLANTIGYIDSTPAHEFYLSGEIQSATPSLGPTVGIAVTCEVDSSTPDNIAEGELYWEQLDEMAKNDLPMVWVVKALGTRPEHECVIGDGMAKTLYAVGCNGIVTDGRVRDVSGLLTTPFAAYCKGKAVHHVPMRFLACNRPVEVGGVTIHPGDVLHANSEGVIRIPKTCINVLAETAVRMRAFEHKAHMILRRTNLLPKEKRTHIQELLSEYGFADCVTQTKR